MVDSVMILGGYGTAGRVIAQLLLEHTGCAVGIAGRDPERAARLTHELAARFGADRVSWTTADAADGDSLVRAIDATPGCRVLVAASPTADQVTTVARAALARGVDYLDLQYSSAKIAALQALSEEIAAAGACFVTDGGFHPGLPAALVRSLAGRFDPGRLSRAIVGSVIQIDWRTITAGPATIEELARELADFQMLEFRDGAWRRSRWWTTWVPDWMDFGHGFGRRYVVPMFLEEMRDLPDLFPGLREVGFEVGGFNWFVDWFILPLALAGKALFGERALRPAGHALVWGLRRFSRPPFGTLLKVQAVGERAGSPATGTLELYHPDGYHVTAAPVVACLMQLLDGHARTPGLWLQAHLVDPDRLLVDLAAMGIEVTDGRPAPLSTPQR